MARKVTEDDIARWKELRNKGYTFGRIGSEVGWASETIRKHISGEERKAQREEPKKTPQARAFQMFRDGKTPADVVMEGVATPSEAKTMWRDYHELKGLNPPEERLKKAEDWIEQARGNIDVFLLILDIDNKPCPVTGCGGKIGWRGKSDGVDEEGYYCSNWKKDKTGCYIRVIAPYEW